MKRFVDSSPNIKKREDEDLRRFVDFIRCERVSVLDKPDETQKGRSRKGKFDYLIQLDDSEEKIAIEFTQIFEKEEQIVRDLQWGNLVNAFRKELKRFNWSGSWIVETPENFGATEKEAKIIARKNAPKLINAIVNGSEKNQDWGV